MLIKYIRNEENVPIGAIVADQNQYGGIVLGYSLCNKKDKFNKQRALEIAVGRMNKFGAFGYNPKRQPPENIVVSLEEMFYRARRYFKKGV